MTIKTKTQIQAEIAALFPDNTSQAITAANLRAVTIDMVDSYFDGSGGPLFYARDLGIVGDGITDDTVAIQAAINSLNAQGGTIVFNAGMNCKITSTLKIGNGTKDAYSTRGGVYLYGEGVDSIPNSIASTLPPSVVFTWAGAATDFVQILGPLQGWGISNIVLNGVNVPTIGLHVISGQFGACDNLYVWNCVVGVQLDTQPSGGTLSNTAAVCNAWRNWFKNLFVIIPNIGNAKGIYLTNNMGSPPAAYQLNNSCYNRFDHVNFYFPGTAATAVHGLYLRDCDTNAFRDIQTVGSGNTLANAVTLDFGGNNQDWPNGELIDHIDPVAAANGKLWNIVGTPSNNNTPVLINNVALGNVFATTPTNPGYPTNERGILTDVAKGYGSVIKTAQAASIGTTTINTVERHGMFRASWSLDVQNVQAAITVSITLTWSNGSTITFTSTTLSLAGAGNLGGSNVFFGETGTVISYATTIAGGVVTTARYGLNILLERLT